MSDAKKHKGYLSEKSKKYLASLESVYDKSKDTGDSYSGCVEDLTSALIVVDVLNSLEKHRGWLSHDDKIKYNKAVDSFNETIKTMDVLFKKPKEDLSEPEDIYEINERVLLGKECRETIAMLEENYECSDLIYLIKVIKINETTKHLSKEEYNENYERMIFLNKIIDRFHKRHITDTEGSFTPSTFLSKKCREEIERIRQDYLAPQGDNCFFWKYINQINDLLIEIDEYDYFKTKEALSQKQAQDYLEKTESVQNIYKQLEKFHRKYTGDGPLNNCARPMSESEINGFKKIYSQTHGTMKVPWTVNEKKKNISDSDGCEDIS
jgi:hypothetical protein